MIFFGELKAGRSSFSAFEFSSKMLRKPFKPWKIQTNIKKSYIYRFIAVEDTWGKCGHWIASSNGWDLSGEGVVKEEENFESGPSIAQRSTVGSGKWKVKMGNVDWATEVGDEIWTIDLQIISTMETNWMSRRSPVNYWASSVSDSRWMARPWSGFMQERNRINT